MEGEVAVILDDVAQGAGAETAGSTIRLVMLANDVSLRNIIPGELGKGFGFFQGKPSSSFSPVAVTPDELGIAWDGARLRGALSVRLNGEPFGKARTEVDMTFDFPTLIAHAARTRPLSAGTIVGSGTVSNRGPDGGPGQVHCRWRCRIFVHRRTEDGRNHHWRGGKNTIFTAGRSRRDRNV